MEYLERIAASLAVLSFIIIGRQYYLKNKRIKWLCYISAAVIWGVAQYMLHANWIEMIISIAGIGLFAWLIGGAIDDHRDLRKTR